MKMNANDVTNSILGRKEGFQNIYKDTERIQKQTDQIRKARKDIEDIMVGFEI